MITATTGANSLFCKIDGKYTIIFNDGVTISFNYPNFLLDGTVIGKRTVNFTDNIVVHDLVKIIIY